MLIARKQEFYSNGKQEGDMKEMCKAERRNETQQQ